MGQLFGHLRNCSLYFDPIMVKDGESGHHESYKQAILRGQNFIEIHWIIVDVFQTQQTLAIPTLDCW